MTDKSSTSSELTSINKSDTLILHPVDPPRLRETGPFTGLLPPPEVSDAEWFRRESLRVYRARTATLGEINRLPYPNPADLDYERDIPSVLTVIVRCSGERVLTRWSLCGWDELVSSEDLCWRLFWDAYRELDRHGLPLPDGDPL